MFNYLQQIPVEAYIGFLLLILIVLVGILIILQIFHHSRVSGIANPIYDHIVKKAQKQSQNIIAEAMDKARELKVEGELKGIKAVARDKVESKKLLSEYETALQEISSQTRQYIQERGQDMVSSYENLSKTLEEEVQEDFGTLRQSIKYNQKRVENSFKSIDMLLEEAKETGEQTKESLVAMNETYMKQLQDKFDNRFETTLTNFEEGVQSMNEKIEKNITERMTTALKTAEKEVEDYKKAREEIINKDLGRVVEYVTAEILKKDLSVDDHAQLAKRSLDEALEEGVFDSKESSSS